MNKFQLLELLKGYWAIDQKYAMLHFGSVANFIQGNFMYEKANEALASQPYASGPGTERSSFNDAPEGSVAVIPVMGVMTKNDQFCGPVGTATIASRIKQATDSKNINAIVLAFDSGGGGVNSIPPLADAIETAKSSGKPVVSFVDDTMASAALMAGSHANLIIAAHDMAEIGSLGVMAHFADFQPVSEKEGIVFHKIYADQSSDKNKTFDDALKGDYKLLKEKELNPLAQAAIDKMKKQRGDKITDASVYSANMFFAKEAVKIGLIDEIGNLDYAINRASELASGKKTKANHNNSTHSKTRKMNKKTLPALMMILGLESLEASTEGKYNLSAEQIQTLQTNFADNYAKQLIFKGASFDEDGSAELSEDALHALNSTFTQAMLEKNKTAGTDKDLKHADQLAKLQAKIDKMGGEPEDLDLGNIEGKKLSDFTKNATGVNAIDDSRPWNAAALAIAEGRRQESYAFSASGITDEHIETFIADYRKAESKIDIEQMNEELGAFHREVKPEIQSMLVASEEISRLFPWHSTGIKDEYTRISSYITEHLQPRNPGDWADKGSDEFQAESDKLKNWEVTRTYRKEQMFQFIQSWLATKTKGTDPYQQSFLDWFISHMMQQISLVERPINAIRGVYVTPEANKPGRSINSMDGLFKTLQRLISQNRILPMKVGKGTYSHLNETEDEINKDHIFYKINDMIMMLPQNLRDAYLWDIYISKHDQRERNKFIKHVLASDANYKEQEKANSFDNFTIVPVPHWQDGLIIITLKKNAIQLYRDKNDDNRIYVEKLKRNTHVHMDGAYGFMFPMTGKKFETLAELKQAKYQFQRIFTNAEFGAYTSEPLKADVTAPSVKNHNVLLTAENTTATTLTTIADAIVGQTVYIIGGSDVNPSKILKTNTAFIGLKEDIVFTAGTVVAFEMTDVGKFTLTALADSSNNSAILFDADDDKPSVGGGYLFITSAENTAGNAAITDFANAQVGKRFKVIGGGGAEPSTIAKSGKFAHISTAWTGTAGEEIILQKRTFGDFVEVTE